MLRLMYPTYEICERILIQEEPATSTGVQAGYLCHIVCRLLDIRGLQAAHVCLAQSIQVQEQQACPNSSRHCMTLRARAWPGADAVEEVGRQAPQQGFARSKLRSKALPEASSAARLCQKQAPQQGFARSKLHSKTLHMHQPSSISMPFITCDSGSWKGCKVPGNSPILCH